METAAFGATFPYGVVALGVAIVALLIFTVAAIVLAFVKQGKGWIIAAIVSSVLSLVAVSIGMVGAFRAMAVALPGFLASDKTRRAVSKDGWISLELPRRWTPMSDLHDDAGLGAGNVLTSEFVLVLSEPLGDVDETKLDLYGEAARAALVESLEDGQVGEVQPLLINGYPAFRCRLVGNTSGLRIAYLHTCIQTPDGFHQILLWTEAAREPLAWPTFEKVAASFRVAAPRATPPPTTPRPRTGTVEERVRDIVVEHLGQPPEQVQPASRLSEDLKADELDLVELVMTLEEEFEISITDEEISALKTVGDLVRVATERKKAP